MNQIKIFILCLTVSLLSACGTGEFFIKRAVNGLQDDVADEFKNFADFNQDQERDIDLIAQQIDTWVRTDRLPTLYAELEKIARDIEDNSKVSDATWATTVAFLERPMNLAERNEVIIGIANVAHSMNDEQTKQATKKLQKERLATLKEQRKLTLEKQNKKLAKGFKVVFRELGVSRTKEQLMRAKSMLAQRKSHIELDAQATEQDYETFINLIRNQQLTKTEYLSKFSQAWETAERGAKHQAPELWEHNAKVALDILNYLLSDLNQDQRNTAAMKIRDYANLFKELSIKTDGA